jgi:hypothetical protein
MKVLSNWRSVRLWESAFERDLHRRHSLRTHGLLLGTCTLLLMWAVSALQMRAGNDSLALRYAVTLGVGYLGYLGLLRWWAQRLVEGRAEIDPDLIEVLDVPSSSSSPSMQVEAGDASAIATSPVARSKRPPARTKAPSSWCRWSPSSCSGSHS